MEKFLETYNIPILNQEKVETLHRSITSTEIKSVSTNFSVKKSPGPHGFTRQFYQTFKSELILILLKLFANIFT